jgi:hypothetical protein
MLACLTRRGRPLKSPSACPIPSGGSDPDPGPVTASAGTAGCGSPSSDSSHGGRDAVLPSDAGATGVNVVGEPP